MNKQIMLSVAAILCVAALAIGVGMGAAQPSPVQDIGGPEARQGLEAAPVASRADAPEPESAEKPDGKTREFRFGPRQFWDGDSIKETIEQAVGDGKITREAADELLKIFENKDAFWDAMPEITVPGLSEVIERFHIFDGEGFTVEGFLGEDSLPEFSFHSGPPVFFPGREPTFFGDYFEENKDKTLGQLKDEWLAEVKAKLDEAVASGTMTREEADEAYQNAADGKHVLLLPDAGEGILRNIPGFGHGFRYEIGLGPDGKSETNPGESSQNTAKKY